MTPTDPFHLSRFITLSEKSAFSLGFFHRVGKYYWFLKPFAGTWRKQIQSTVSVQSV